MLGNDAPEASLPGEIVYDGRVVRLRDQVRRGPDALVVPGAAWRPSSTDALRELAVAAFRAIDCAGMARVDFFLERRPARLVNEINTIPGFTSTSVLRQDVGGPGLAYPDLVAAPRRPRPGASPGRSRGRHGRSRSDVVIAGGGTGGHTSPGLAVAALLRERGVAVRVDRQPRRYRSPAGRRAGIPYHAIPTGKLRRYWAWRTSAISPSTCRPACSARASLAAPARVRDVVLATGGFVALPVVLARRGRARPDRRARADGGARAWPTASPPACARRIAITVRRQRRGTSRPRAWS